MSGVLKQLSKTEKPPVNSSMKRGMVLVGCCIDHDKRKVKTAEAEKLAEKYGIKYVEVSILGDTNVNLCFELLAKDSLQNFQLAHGQLTQFEVEESQCIYDDGDGDDDSRYSVTSNTSRTTHIHRGQGHQSARMSRLTATGPILNLNGPVTDHSGSMSNSFRVSQGLIRNASFSQHQGLGPNQNAQYTPQGHFPSTQYNNNQLATPSFHISKDDEEEFWSSAGPNGRAGSSANIIIPSLNRSGSPPIGSDSSSVPPSTQASPIPPSRASAAALPSLRNSSLMVPSGLPTSRTRGSSASAHHGHGHGHGPSHGHGHSLASRGKDPDTTDSGAFDIDPSLMPDSPVHVDGAASRKYSQQHGSIYSFGYGSGLGSTTSTSIHASRRTLQVSNQQNPQNPAAVVSLSQQYRQHHQQHPHQHPQHHQQQQQQTKLLQPSELITDNSSSPITSSPRRLEGLSISKSNPISNLAPATSYDAEHTKTDSIHNGLSLEGDEHFVLSNQHSLGLSSDPFPSELQPSTELPDDSGSDSDSDIDDDGNLRDGGDVSENDNDHEADENTTVETNKKTKQPTHLARAHTHGTNLLNFNSDESRTAQNTPTPLSQSRTVLKSFPNSTITVSHDQGHGQENQSTPMNQRNNNNNNHNSNSNHNNNNNNPHNNNIGKNNDSVPIALAGSTLVDSITMDNTDTNGSTTDQMLSSLTMGSEDQHSLINHHGPSDQQVTVMDSKCVQVGRTSEQEDENEKEEEEQKQATMDTSVDIEISLEDPAEEKEKQAATKAGFETSDGEQPPKTKPKRKFFGCFG